MQTRFVPDAAATWLVYDLGSLVLALPAEFRAVAEALAAMPRGPLAGVIATLDESGVAGGTPFAVLDSRADGVHVALRGPATVSAGTDTLTGLGVETWLERDLPGVRIVRLTIPGGEWTFTFGPTVAPTPQLETGENTAIPDERSVPPMPGPPPLGLADETDRADLRSELAVPVEPPTRVVVPAGPKLSLELPDGSRQPLDAVVLVGRAPSAPDGVPATRLVRLEGDGDISRSHARVAVEGGTVVVTDLGSRNGTVGRIPGHPAQKLRAGEPTPVLVDTVIDFGGGIEVSVREG